MKWISVSAPRNQHTGCIHEVEVVPIECEEQELRGGRLLAAFVHAALFHAATVLAAGSVGRG
eukprot:scaffold106731_cov20-Tisochrysis_lutea.AAC.1